MVYKIVKKQTLNQAVELMEIHAPYVARKCEPGQFIIIRVDEDGERVPLTIADFDRMFFFPQNELARNQAKKMFEIIAEKEGLTVLGWRNVPSKPEVLGHRAVECMPAIMQCFIKRPHGVKRGLPFDRKLYVARRVFEQSNEDTYVVSLSSRTIVYKGMFLVGDLRNFFLDLQDEDYESAIAMVHSRFSTNTNPSWQRAHPNRMIVHNGEINTIRGNADKMLAREETMRSEHLKGDLDKVIPVVNTEGSDSAMLDNTLEFLVMSGMELPLAVMITIPEPWDNNGTMSQKKKDFYQYYATMMEPWDGPASILFSDGDIMGAVLDRNGLRPSRYYITDDGNLILSSEVGALPIDPAKIVTKERLRPGKMLLAINDNKDSLGSDSSGKGTGSTDSSQAAAQTPSETASERADEKDNQSTSKRTTGSSQSTNSSQQTDNKSSDSSRNSLTNKDISDYLSTLTSLLSSK